MNVSSVKNLNGETFSAVQDTDLTTVVQTNSATWGQGGGSTSGLVSGTNVVKVPYFEGEPDGEYWSACISGDVKVAYGEYYNETDFHENQVYSLSAIGADIGNKLNKNTIEDSKTIRSINNKPYEVFDIAYKRTNLANGSAREINIDDDAQIQYDSDDVVNHSKLYSASITAETTATGSIEAYRDVWKIKDFSNGSAILTAIYPAGIRNDDISLFTWGGWGPITNCEATCTVYTSAELSQLAFKDDIPSGGGGEFPVSADEAVQYVQTNSAGIDETVNSVNTNSGAWGGSALPISAGPGIKVNMVDNTLVFSNDETVLFNSENGTIGFTASEPLTNFEHIRFYLASVTAASVSEITLPMFKTNESKLNLYWSDDWNDNGNDWNILSWRTKLDNTGMSAFSINKTWYFGTTTSNAFNGGTYGTGGPVFYKVIGINRK